MLGVSNGSTAFSAGRTFSQLIPFVLPSCTMSHPATAAACTIAGFPCFAWAATSGSLSSSSEENSAKSTM